MSTAKRKLAAIVFADIAGYTDKANQDESAALASRDRVERLIKASTISHNGRLIKTMGDGAMLEFASAVEAVSCALDIQDQMDHLNEELKLPEPVAVRVGVHVGDVVEEENDLYGNAVNIASRVHAMAKPGGICITREVYVQIRPILKLQCMPVPGSSTDRMPEKVEVFTVLGEEDPMTPQRRPKRFLWALAGVGLAAIAIGGIVLMSNGSIPKNAGSPGTNIVSNSHRLLLPDWVTPGEWFSLDAGDHTADLAVYFGNKKADSKVEDGKLMVQTPSDIPTEQTTIAVFEGSNSQALMRQQTQVIRYGALAMNTRPSPQDTLGQSGPSIDIKSNKIDQENAKPESTPGKSVPNRPLPPTPGEGTSTPKPPTNIPKAGGTPVMSGMPPLGESSGYDAFVENVDWDSPRAPKFEFKELKRIPGSIVNAMKAMNLAQSGKKEDATKTIRIVRDGLKNVPPNIAVETESLLKTAEAFVTDVPRAGTVRVGSHPKFAEAFAFSLNRGTRNLPGLLFVDQEIREKKPIEARRALEVLKACPDLTDAEKKAVEKLEARVKKLEETAKSGG